MNSDPRDQELRYAKPLDDQTLLAYFNRCHEDSSDFFSPWREKLPKLFSMYGGRMLSQQDRKYLKSLQKPEIEFNFALGTLNAILGQDMANRSEVIYRGEALGYPHGYIADWSTQLGMHYLGRCRSLMHEWDAAHEMLVAGYGWAAGFLNVNVIPMRPVLERVHCWEMFPDPNATEDNLADARFLIRKRLWSLEEAEARWPDRVDLLRGAGRTFSGLVPPSFPKLWRNDEWRNFSGSANPNARIPIYEFQYKRYEPYVRFWQGDDQNGKFVDVPEPDWKKQMAALGKTAAPDGGPITDKPPGYPYAKECVYRAFIAGQGDTPGEGGVVLQHTKLSVPTFTYNCTTGFKDKNPDSGRVTFFGPASVIYDAQHYINRSLSLIMEIVATSSKGGGFIEQSALTGSIEAFQRDAAKPGFYHVVADGAVSEERIMQKPVGTVPPVISEFLRLCMDALGRLTGVTDYVKGTATSERSNVLISNLQNQSMTLLLPLFEPLGQFRIANGVLLNRIALAHLPVHEIDRVLSAEPVEGLTHTKQLMPVDEPDAPGQADEPDAQPGMMPGQPGAMGDPGAQQQPMAPPPPPQMAEQWVPIKDADGVPITAGALLKQIDPTDYDVTADVGQGSPTMKALFWSVMENSNILQAMQNSGLPIDTFILQMLRFSPLPTAAANKIADELEKATGNRPLDPQTIINALAQLPLQQRGQVLMAAQQQLQQESQQPQANAAPQQAPPPPQGAPQGAPAPA